MTDQPWSWNSFNLISMKSKAFFKTNSRQRLIEAYARTQNDEHQKSKNGKTRLFRKLWISKRPKKQTHYKFRLKTLWNERKRFLNYCFNKFRNTSRKAKTQRTRRRPCSLYQTQKESWRCSKQNLVSQQRFEQTTIWMRTKSSDWRMKNHKHLISCSTRKWKKQKCQANRFELILMKITPTRKRKPHIDIYILLINGRTRSSWDVKKKQSVEK